MKKVKNDKEIVLEKGWQCAKELDPTSEEYHLLINDLVKAEDVVDRQCNDKKRVNIELLAAILTLMGSVIGQIVGPAIRINKLQAAEDKGNCFAGWRQKHV